MLLSRFSMTFEGVIMMPQFGYPSRKCLRSLNVCLCMCVCVYFSDLRSFQLLDLQRTSLLPTLCSSLSISYIMYKYTCNVYMECIHIMCACNVYITCIHCCMISPLGSLFLIILLFFSLLPRQFRMSDLQAGWWWCTPLIPALRRQRQVDL